MLSNEEREIRRTQVGASDVPKIMNFDNKSALNLWNEKVGDTEYEELSNKYITFGNLTEEGCLRDYMGEKKHTLNERVEHPAIKNFVASTDAIKEERIPVENKGINARAWLKLTKPSKDYLIQVMSQIACLNAPYGEIVFNKAEEDDYEHPLLYEPSDKKRKVFVIDRDEQLITEIELRVEYFLICMQEHIKPSESDYKKWSKKHETANELHR